VHWLYAILAGLLAAPIGFLAGTAVAYLLFTLRGISEREGRRGLLAGTIGGPIGILAGFIAGFRTAWWLVGGGGGSLRGLLAGCLIGVPAGLVLGGVALVLGVRLAERRGVTNYAGERAAWSLFHVALPTFVATGAGGFLLGWSLSRP